MTSWSRTGLWDLFISLLNSLHRSEQRNVTQNNTPPSRPVLGGNKGIWTPVPDAKPRRIMSSYCVVLHTSQNKKKTKKNNFPFLSLWRCWAAPLLVGISMRVETEKKHTHWAPPRPPSLWNKTKKNTLQGKDLSKAKFQEFPFSPSELLTSFDRSLGEEKDEHGWVKRWRKAICESRCWYFTWAPLQTGVIDD